MTEERPISSCITTTTSSSLASILRLTPVPTIVTDADRRICLVSDSYLTLSRCQHDPSSQEDVYHFLAAALPPSSLTAIRSIVEGAVAALDVRQVPDLPTRTAAFWSVRAAPIVQNDSLAYIVFEVSDTTTERLRAQALHEERYLNETYRILVETVRDYAIFMLDTGGNVATWNAGAKLLKGYSRDEILGRHFSTFYSDEDKQADKPGYELAVCLREGKVEDEGWRYRKDGSRFWANVVITAVYRAGVLVGFSKVTRDLTERRAAEARLISAYEESAKLKSMFLANMSHEIRTPMHGMLSALALLQETSLTTDQQELASIVHESGGVLLQTINDILDYSKLASGNFSIWPTTMSLPSVVASVVRTCGPAAKQGVQLTCSVDDDVPRAAEGDPLRYRQILQNLIGNAVKFTDVGTILARASVASEDADSFTVLTEVVDTGIGVAPYAVESLFTPFTQFDTSMTKKYQGTGLGLSICKSLAELMGGSIGFKPNPSERGSVFWFTVKMAKVLRSAEDEPQAVGNRQATVVLRSSRSKALSWLQEMAPKKRVLVAEDNSINQKVMLKMLRGLGFESIDMVSTGLDASQTVRDNPNRFDIILMDIHMPLLDGVGATVEIRSAGISTPIVATTANALKGAAEAFLAKGMNDYIAKPVDKEILIQVLFKWLS